MCQAIPQLGLLVTSLSTQQTQLQSTFDLDHVAEERVFLQVLQGFILSTYHLEPVQWVRLQANYQGTTQTTRIIKKMLMG
jgi:hypothetical protein